MTSPLIFPVDAVREQAAGELVTVLAVGPWHEREFAAARADAWEADRWPTVESLDAAIDRCQSPSTPPELVLLAQPLPGYYRQQDVDRLQQAAPLARIVVVAGTWCEGELRTGTRLTGVLRLYWYEFAPWWQTARERAAAGLCPPWSVPFDTPQAGRCLDSARKMRPAKVAIDAVDYSFFESLSAALGGYGLAAEWQARGQSARLEAAAGIWDGGQLDRREVTQLADFCRRFAAREAPVVALLDFPRVEHREQASAAGAATVLGKPVVVEELVGALAAGLGDEPARSV